MNDDDSWQNDPSDWAEILSAIAASWPPRRWCNVGVVVGCSGGADSVACLRALTALREKQPSASGFLVAAHFHHARRGEAADADAEFVRNLAESLGIPYQLGHAADRASDEAGMRDARARFLRETAQNAGARYVVVAHSTDDNVETVLHHLMRGTGPKGLAGIPVNRAMGPDPIGQDLVLMRPLLTVRREQIRAGLRAIGQAWREDTSNDNTAYRRNWIRAQLLPLMESQFPNVVDAVARLIASQSDWRATIEQFADDWLEQQVTSTGDSVHIQRGTDTRDSIIIAGLQNIWTDKAWPLGEMAQEHWLRLSNTIRSHQQQRYTLPGNVDVQADADTVMIRAQA